MQAFGIQVFKLAVSSDQYLAVQANVNEIMAASVVFMRQVPVDRPCTSWNNSRDLRHFSVLRKMDNQPFPTGKQYHFPVEMPASKLL